MGTVEPAFSEERDPLLVESTPVQGHERYGTVANVDDLRTKNGSLIRGLPNNASDEDGEIFDNVPKEKRQLGLMSLTFHIFNLIIGTGIYATPSLILRSAGSVGVAFVMWMMGALIVAIGMTVYIELGTGLPRSGGEKNYLEFIYRKPRFLISCVISVYCLLRTAAPNSVVLSEYTLHAIGITHSPRNTLVLAISALTFVAVLHSVKLQWGVRLQNILGAFKILVLLAVSIVGLLCLSGVPGFEVREGYEMPHNLEWSHLWEGSNFDTQELVTGLYNVLWAFDGYSYGNSVLSEVKHPARTAKYASSIALSLAITLYFLANIAYFSVVSKNDILGSRTIIISLFFRNLFGEATERIASALVALSVLGNLLSSFFSHGRAVQELAREGILPFSEIIASNKPFGAPLPAIFVLYIVACTYLLVTPTGDAYLFLITLGAYCTSLINTLVALGVTFLHVTRLREWQWNPPFRAPNIAVYAFLISNLFLVTFPLVPPKHGNGTYEKLPYWSHSVTAFAVSLVGYIYWYWFAIWKPRRNGYILEKEWVLQDDGVSRYAFRKVPVEQPPEEQ